MLFHTTPLEPRSYISVSSGMRSDFTVPVTIRTLPSIVPVTVALTNPSMSPVPSPEMFTTENISPPILISDPTRVISPLKDDVP